MLKPRDNQKKEARKLGSPPAFEAKSWKPESMFVVNRWYEGDQLQLQFVEGVEVVVVDELGNQRSDPLTQRL